MTSSPLAPGIAPFPRMRFLSAMTFTTRRFCTFDGVIGLRKALLARPEIFVSTMTGKLMTYALGRGLDYYDEPAVRAILRDSRADDYKFSSIVLGIVNSTPFRMRRSQ